MLSRSRLYGRVRSVNGIGLDRINDDLRHDDPVVLRTGLVGQVHIRRGAVRTRHRSRRDPVFAWLVCSRRVVLAGVVVATVEPLGWWLPPSRYRSSGGRIVLPGRSVGL
jgi:hypothetical protein